MGQVICPVLVGREKETQALEEALDAVESGRGSCTVITGEAGIGKSRLVSELVRTAAARDLTVVAGRAVPAATSSPYRPITEALVQLLRRSPPDGAVKSSVWFPHLAPLLPGVIAPEEVATGASSPVIRGEAVLQLLRAQSPGAVVIAIEDLHWADPDTVALVEYLADNVADDPVMLALTLRLDPPTSAGDLVRRQRGRRGIAHLALERLDRSGVAAMVAACAPDAGAHVLTRIEKTAEGIPLFVEELLASPGVPESIAETVRVRLAELSGSERRILEAAAVMGRGFDWAILPAATGADAASVSEALTRAVEQALVTADGGSFQFRHALIREAVLSAMLPPRLTETAAKVLAAVDQAHPWLEGTWRDVAADLAARSGDRHRAGLLLLGSGRYSLEVGALATAVDTLRRASDLLPGSPLETDAELALVEGLALAGRVDEAAAAGQRLMKRLGDDPEAGSARIEAHLRVAQAAVAASRWSLATQHVEAAEALVDATNRPDFAARAAVLSADIAMAANDLDRARTAAQAVLQLDGAAPDVRCHAYEIVGRAERLHDLRAAGAAFEAALSTAEDASLAVWRLRALHELGTIDLFARAEIRRLLEARKLAEEMGALSTLAVLDLQLSASYTARWDLARCDRHARSALDLAGHLGLAAVQAKALALMAGSASMRADVEGAADLAARTIATDPADDMLKGLCRASVGMALLLAGDTEAALGPFAEGTSTMSRVPNAEPIAIRALWPLLQAVIGDRRAPQSIEEARRLGVGAISMNSGLIALAEAVLAGRRGEPRRADAITSSLDAAFVNCQTWADLGRFLAAPRAIADRWGEPERWLRAAGRRFDQLGLDALARRAGQLLADLRPNPWAGAGVTDREAEVLRQIIDGRANKEIAAALRVSPRTVEKHVESLLRKTGARSRTELAVAHRAPSA